MLVVKLSCSKCGSDFEFNPADYSIKGLQNIPKACTRCCDERQGLEKVVVSRHCLRHWEGVKIVVPPVLVDKQERGGYVVGRFGGRNYGNWGGARFDESYLVYINSSITDLNGAVVSVRLMEKVWQKGEGKRTNTYLSIDPSSASSPNYFLYTLASWYKTTIKGFGKDRNYSEYLSDGEFMQETVLSVSTWANSGRFGNKYTIIITDKEVEIVGDGVA